MSYLGIEKSRSAKEIDEILKNKLLYYAYYLALVLADTFWGYPYFGMKKSSINSELNEIDKIKRNLLESLRLYLEKYPVTLIINKDDNSIIKRFRLQPFFRLLSAREKWIKQYSNLYSCDIAKHPLARKYKIAYFWALLMYHNPGYNREGEIPWAAIIRLMDWFYEGLKDTSYGNNLLTGIKIENAVRKFKKHCYSMIKREDFFDSKKNAGIFMPGYSARPLKINPYSIGFNKESIEIAEKFKECITIHTIKFEKRGNLYLFDATKISDFSLLRKKLPFIFFPNGETFQ
ncbi:MAG: hypothetical protein OEY25_03755 [Candidatus Aminicenantes bacterium]|nr:hypothetical protein [Candidatus Aminicenantes bacterium]MDH5705038.1 hypothetical protein [Candidatus Aminicenantes bacterium]